DDQEFNQSNIMSVNTIGRSPTMRNDDVHDFSAPLDGATHGRLTLEGGASGLFLGAEPANDALFPASFPTEPRRVSVVAPGEVVVELPHHGLFDWLTSPRSSGGRIALSSSLRWNVAMRGGASLLIADLRDVPVEMVVLTGGASDVTLRLGDTPGYTQVVIW